jgi:hypothetical protein
MPEKRTIPRTCAACGKDFLATPTQVKRAGGGRFCSSVCANRTLATVQRGENHPMYKGGPEMVDRVCEQCDTTFSVRASDVKRGNGRYCSLECQRAGIYAARVVRHEQIMGDFWSLYDTSGGPDSCWKWSGKTDENGYGRIFNQLAHRIAHEMANGPIPDGKEVFHSCDTPPCGNPAHLRIGTQLDNIQDMVDRHRYRVGEAHPGSKLTWDDARAIRAACGSGEAQAIVASRYGVTQTVVSRIVRGVAWIEES